MWLISRRGQWIRRRYDTIDFVDSVTVRVRTELTLDLEDFEENLNKGERYLQLPLLLRTRGVASTSTIFDEARSVVPRLNRLEEARTIAQGIRYNSPKSESPTTPILAKGLCEKTINPAYWDTVEMGEQFGELIKRYYFISAKLPLGGPSSRVLTIERFVAIEKSQGYAFVSGSEQRKSTLMDKILPFKNRHMRGLVVAVPIDDWKSSSSYHLTVNAPPDCIAAPLEDVSENDNEKHLVCVSQKKKDSKPLSKDIQKKDSGSTEYILKLDVSNTLHSSAKFTATIPGNTPLPLPPSYMREPTKEVNVILEPIHSGQLRGIVGIVIILGLANIFFGMSVFYMTDKKMSSVAISYGIIIIALLAMGAPLLIGRQQHPLADDFMFFPKALLVTEGVSIILFALFLNLFGAKFSGLLQGVVIVSSLLNVVILGIVASHYRRVFRFASFVSGTETNRSQPHFYCKLWDIESGTKPKSVTIH